MCVARLGLSGSQTLHVAARPTAGDGGEVGVAWEVLRGGQAGVEDAARNHVHPLRAKHCRGTHTRGGEMTQQAFAH